MSVEEQEREQEQSNSAVTAERSLSVLCTASLLLLYWTGVAVRCTAVRDGQS